MEFEEESKNNGLYNSNLSDINPKIVFQAAQIAPIIDRMGRMLIDFAPHVNSIVKSHQNRLRDMSNSQNNNLGLGG